MFPKVGYKHENSEYETLEILVSMHYTCAMTALTKTEVYSWDVRTVNFDDIASLYINKGQYPVYYLFL